MTDNNQKFKSLLKSYIKKELEEITTTGDIAGYNTPFAFSKNKKKKKIKYAEGKTSEIQEGKSLFHLYRDQPDYTPTQKIGVTIREINKRVVEIEKLLKVTEKYKSEMNIDSKTFWKTTNKKIVQLEDRLRQISMKLLKMR